MEMYQHDSDRTFRFVLRGALEGHWIQELQHTWTTARSVLKGKKLVVDISGMTGFDEEGLELLSRMRESGARLNTVAPPASPDLARLLGIPAPPPASTSQRLRARL